MVYLVPGEEMVTVIATLMRQHRVLAPVSRLGAIAFAPLDEASEAILDYSNTACSPKSAFFPQVEPLMRFERQPGNYNEVTSVLLDTTPTILFALRPCDARAFTLLDRIFEQEPYVDPYYRLRRRNTLVMSLACSKPRRTCFCHALGGGPYDSTGSDILMREADGDYILEGISERGEDLLAGLGLATASSDALARAEEVQAAAMERLADMAPVSGIEMALANLFEHPTLWQRVSETCLACGTCTYSCPACHCFNIDDRVFARSGERVRAWDSCMYPGFTVQASGNNPRPDQAARWRQRVMHKFAYLPRNVGMYGCVGCGRCVLSCPVRLDIRNVLSMVREAAMGEEVRE